MEVFVARQPIFDDKENIIAYELLFRNNLKENYASLNNDMATYDVMVNSFILIGLGTLTDSKTAFVNFTENALLKGIPELLPKEYTTIEILEDVNPTKEIIEICKKLKSQGYILALDDFEDSEKLHPLIELANIIKVDFILNNRDERKKIVEKYRDKNIKFLAEKVETKEEYREAIEMGYSYFQGYFFSKPTIVKGEDIPINYNSRIDLIKKLNNRYIQIEDLEEIIKQDVSLAYKLFKYVNSASFGMKNQVKSIKQALALFGNEEMTKWMTLIILRDLQNNANQNVLRLSVIRARFCELICEISSNQEKSNEAFVMGMFSTIDSILGKNMKDALAELAVTDDVSKALLGEESFLYYLYQLVLSYESGKWINFSMYCKRLKINEKNIPKYYIKSLEWAKAVFEE